MSDNLEIVDIMISAFDHYHRWVDVEMEKDVRKNALPPIKGAITKGKLSHRGLKVVTQQYTGETWVEQRGKIITPKYSKEMWQDSKIKAN